MRPLKKFRVPSLFLLCVGATPAAWADVSVAPPFASHMVLQRDLINPVWGQAGGGEEVSVTVNGQTQTTTAAGDGSWMVELDPMDAGGPFTVTIQGNNSVQLQDVYVGEVWQAAGQSNMDTRLSFYPNLSGDIAAANHPTMRYFTVRQPGNPPTTWEVVTPQTAGDFSAMAYFFAKEIQETTGVAVGIVVTAVGGTTISSWMDPDTLAANPQINNDDRGSMFNSWVSPVVGYGIRGTIWIQGEQNTNGTDSPTYGDYFNLLIEGWREAWGQGDFPFYYGQLSNVHSLQTDPNNTSNVARVREGQRMALALPETAMSVNMDIGSAGDWHFPNKPEAGRRMSLPARALVYGETDLVYSGPLYLSSSVEGDEVTLNFDHVGGGLVAKDGGELVGFAIAGAAGDWVWGDAEIRGDTIVVKSAAVPNPTRVRYAWGDNPILSLYNDEGLPAPSFTTESKDLQATSTGGGAGSGGSMGTGGDLGSGGGASGGTSNVGTGGAATGGAGPLEGTGGGANGGGLVASGGSAAVPDGSGGTADGASGSGDESGSNSEPGCTCSSVGTRRQAPNPTSLLLAAVLVLGGIGRWKLGQSIVQLERKGDPALDRDI